jgi:ribonuclease R
MKQPDQISQEDVLALLAGARRAMSVREMAEALGAKHDGRRRLKKLVQELKRRKAVEELHGGKYVLLEGRETQRLKAQTNPGMQRSQRYMEKAGPESRAHQSPVTSHPSQITGRLVAHRDGFGFVVPERPLPNVTGDLFVSPANIGDAMHGDTVAVRILRHRPDGRAEAAITRIARRAHPTVVGVFQYGPRGNVVAPYETRIQGQIVIPPGEELPAPLRARMDAEELARYKKQRAPRLAELDGAVVDVELTRFPKGGVTAAGRVVEILGRPGEIGTDVEIVIRKHHLPYRFPEEVEAEAAATPATVRESDLAGREDFRHLPIVTIDGETARDFDDAVHVEALPGGAYRLQVHIADVAHYVRRGAPLDREARLRGTSVYFPNRAVPMLPEALSNGICSLNPQVNRLVMSAVMDFDARGAMLAARFTPGVICSAERMTYTSVNQVLEGDTAQCARYAVLVEHFRRMRELALLLNTRRNGRGSIDFDLPEPVIEFDELGRMTSIARSQRNIAHRIIEEFMLAANQAVAQFLENHAIPSLSRIHEKPDPKKVLEFEELAKAFGYSLGVPKLATRQVVVKHGATLRHRQRGRHGREHGGREQRMVVELPADLELDIRPQHYQRLAQKIAGKAEERILSYLMLRSLKQARYAAEPLGHFALAMDSYTHFTSPIRRYPDLIVHRILKWALQNAGEVLSPVPSPRAVQPKQPARLKSGATKQGQGPYTVSELEEIASESSEAERRADGAERELMDWKTAQFMEQHLGDEYEALIISVVKFGVFVELLEVFVEGLVPITALEEFAGGRCQFRERDRAMVAEGARGQTKSFHLGGRVRVRAERIDHTTQRVEFALLAVVQ